jgi:hypothetical protein
MPVGKANIEDGKQGVFVNSENALGEMIGKLLGCSRTRQAGLRVAAARAIAGEHCHFVPLFIFAAIGNTFVVMLEIAFFQAAATGMVGPSLGRAPADIAVAGTFTSYGVGNDRRAHGERRKWAHGDH